MTRSNFRTKFLTVQILQSVQEDQQCDGLINRCFLKIDCGTRIIDRNVIFLLTNDTFIDVKIESIFVLIE